MNLVSTHSPFERIFAGEARIAERESRPFGALHKPFEGEIVEGVHPNESGYVKSGVA